VLATFWVLMPYIEKINPTIRTKITNFFAGPAEKLIQQVPQDFAI